MPRRWRFWRVESDHCQRAVKDGEAYDFRPGDVRSVQFPFGREEAGAGGINDAGLLPLARKHVSGLIRVRVDVRGNRHTGGKFAQHRDAAGLFVFVEDQKLNARIRAGLPFLV